MTKRQFLLWLLQFVLVAILGALRFVERHSGGDEEGTLRTLTIFVFDHRLLIAVLLIVAVALLAGWKDLIAPRKRAKEIRQKIMSAMLEELFERDKNNYRISIFRKATLFRLLRIYLKQLIDYVRCKKKGESPTFLRGPFVYVSERLGTEHPNSHTYFHYSPDTAQKCQGVAGAAMQGLTDIIVEDLPDVEGIDLATVDLQNKKLNATKKIRDYMSRGYVTDIQTLRRLHKKSRHIYGNILNDFEGKPKGVLVIDSFLDDSFLSPDVIARLSHYATIIGATM